MRIYLAGPMRGQPNLNFPAFHAAAGSLRQQGHEVFSPAELSPDIQTELRLCFAADTNYIALYADAVALLPGWEHSRGARAEKALAEALDLQVMYL